MSIAGMICMAAVGRRGVAAVVTRARETDSECASDAPVPGDEIGKQLETGAVALFRMELHGEDISACNRASKRRWIGDCCSRCAGVLGHRIVAVREVKARTILDAVPERMLSHEVHGLHPMCG